MSDENFTGFPGVLDVADEVDGLLVSADIPELISGARVTISRDSAREERHYGEKPYTIARQNDKLIDINLDDTLGGVRMSSHQVLYVAVSESTSDGQNTCISTLPLASSHHTA
jgi:hypothetical protein